MSSTESVPSSFRDPAGFLFRHKGILYRQVNKHFGDEFDFFISSGLYDALVRDGLLIAHETADRSLAQSRDAYAIIRPETVPFISYPYEWCFSQLKAAALATLKIQKRALEFGMSLRDGSAYNIQFIGCHPVFIDTLSFERYREGTPWAAYRQFCQHFLAPLALMAHTDVRLGQLLRIYIDGLPLDLASRLLPKRSRLSFSLLSHIHLHAKSQQHFGDKPVRTDTHSISRHAMLGLIDNLESAVGKLTWKPGRTEWGSYYEQTNYTEAAMEHKKATIADFLYHAHPRTVWDLGANTGTFSRLIREKERYVVAFDIDPAAAETHFCSCAAEGERRILPLLLDLTNPSPALGWDNAERQALGERGQADMAVALALIHHIAIGNNVPLDRCAHFFGRICRWLAIEFVPKRDTQVQRMLANREDIFDAYTWDRFEEAFSRYFSIRKKVTLRESMRILYLMERK